MLTLGEVHTGLLQSSEALPPEAVRRSFDALAGEGTTIRSRPVPVVESVPRLTGVDCTLPSATGTRRRAVGTVSTRMTIVAGRVAQATSSLALTPGTDGRRHPWSYYLARPATVEVLGSWRPDDVATGFLDGASDPAVLSVEGITTRGLDDVQHSGELDGKPPLRAVRTRVRWVATTARAGAPAHVVFRIDSPTVRSVHLSLPPGDVDGAEAICSEIALHDWLLSCLEGLLARARVGHRETSQSVALLRPAVEHLLHLWQPAARLPPHLAAYWREFDRRSGATGQWSAMVLRVRDLVTLAAIDTAGRMSLTDKGAR